MAAVLAVSLVVNVALGLAAVVWLVRRARRRVRPDYATLAAARFGPVAPGAVVWAGDSHVEGAPLSELLGGCVQRGLGGQRIDDLTAWVETLVGARRVVLEVGANDWGRDGASVEDLVARYGRLLDRVPAEPVILALPPDAGRDVRPANDALARLAADRDVQFEPLPDLDGCTTDGVHLDPEGYRRLAPLLRRLLT